MMLGVIITNLGKVAVLRCEGRIVAGDEATALRNAVTSQGSKQTLILDLAKVEAIDGSGLGLLVFLQGWTRSLGIELKLMNKRTSERLPLRAKARAAKVRAAKKKATRRRAPEPATLQKLRWSKRKRA
jgi:anti-anti-sigma regulatory factor